MRYSGFGFGHRPGRSLRLPRIGSGPATIKIAWVCLILGVLLFFPTKGLAYVLIAAAFLIAIRLLVGGRIGHGLALLTVSGVCGALFGFILLFIIADLQRNISGGLQRNFRFDPSPSNAPPPVDMRSKPLPAPPPLGDTATRHEAAVEQAMDSARSAGRQ